MKKLAKTLLCAALALAMALGGLAAAPQAQAAGSFSLAGGWNESLYAEIEGVTDASVTAVSYSGAMTGQLTGQDLQHLVRDTATGVRIDIPGLKSGTYSLTVTADGVTYSQSGIQVTAYDRSGYAHWNYTQGVGAYKDDGTIKDNAVILYVTEENKNSVSLTAGGTTVTGIGNILNTGGKASKNGSLANTNGDILKKLADEGRPLVVRIVGSVTKPAGVTAWGSYDYGGNPDDNGGMCYMKTCKNITIEGIGTDAVVDGWGFAVGCNDGDYANGYNRNFEFRNLTFRNVPEDCIGISGRGGSTLTDPIEHTWVHNCAFFGPSNLPDASDDQDKAEGDGAVDFKWGQYYTMSYCYFEKYHKTHLIGGDNSNLQYHVTWHHNYYKNCESRGPLGRQANMHVYNNVYEGQSSYVMSLNANCYIFSEYNTFINCKRVSQGSNGGVCKSYMNSFTNCTGTTTNDLKIVSDKSQKVSSNNKYASFELDATLGYVAQGDYLLDADAALAKANVLAGAGPMDFANRTAEEEPSTPGETPTPSEGDYVHNFTQSGLSSSFYTISGNLSQKGTVSYNGLALTQCLKLESATSVTFTAPSAGKLVLVFHETGLNGIVAADCTVDLDGKRYDVAADNTVTIPLAAGAHTLKRGDSQIFLYYMFYAPDSAQAHQHSFAGSVTTAATCLTPGVKTFACACGESYTEAIPATGHSYQATVKTPTCTSGGYTTYACPSCGDAYVDDFTPVAAHSYSGGACTACGAADPDWHECSYTAAVTAPTCTRSGYTTYSCTCGSSYVDDFTPAAGHSYSGGACTVCGEKDPDYVAPEAPKQGLQKGDDGNYYYYIDGEIAADFTGLVENSAGRWYVLGGQVQMSYDGLITFEGTKYLIKAGHVNTAFTGITKQQGVYYYFTAGVNDLAFEGLVVCNGMKAYVQGGEVNFNKTGIVEDNGQLLYVKYGIWRNTFKGLARLDNGSWIYMLGGTFDESYTGVAKLNDLWVYVANGNVNFNYSGTVTVNGVDYSVKYGVVQF